MIPKTVDAALRLMAEQTAREEAERSVYGGTAEQDTVAGFGTLGDGLLPPTLPATFGAGGDFEVAEPGLRAKYQDLEAAYSELEAQAQHAGDLLQEAGAMIEVLTRQLEEQTVRAATWEGRFQTLQEAIDQAGRHSARWK